MKKAVIALIAAGAVAGAGFWAYREGYLQKYAGRYLGKIIPALENRSETEEEEGRVSSTDPDAVYLDPVRSLANLGSGDGVIEKFAGVVQPQETKKYTIDSGRTVDQTYVQEGDDVKKGDRLFTYDVDSMKDKLEQAEIDLERLQNSVDVSEAKQAELEKQMAAANTPEKRLQVLEEQNNLKQQKLELKSRQNKIDSINQQIENSTVTSDIDGVVKSVNESAAAGSSDSSYDSSDGGDSSAYITLLKVGTYRVKASCNEQNISSVFTGERVLVHSRVDSSVTWKGTVTQIKTDQGSGNSNGDDGSSGSDSSSGSTNYPFYVELDSSDGLMLGQHVYLEQDVGQADQKDGIWLDNYYFVTGDDGCTYVWAASDSNTLEKRKVELGDTDEDQQKTEVKSGLTADDYICQPSDELKEGMPVAYNDDSGLSDLDLDAYTYEETENTGAGSPYIGSSGDLDFGDLDISGMDTEYEYPDSSESEYGQDLVPISQSEYDASDDSADDEVYS